jgi:hypothetical protein
MSRGPGTWQRQIIHVTSGTVVATVSGIVRTNVVSPDRDDFTSARRAAKQLALAERVNAVYAWCCTKCMRIQDRDDPVPCCGPVRPLLAVCMLERRRLLLHPAPPPGGRAPSWINVAVPSRPQGQLLAPGVADLARVAMQHAYERIEAGEAAVSLQDAVAAMRLAWQIERDEAIPERDAALRQLEKWQQDMTEFTWALRMVLDRQYPGAWPAVMAEVRKHCPAGPR